MYQHQDQLAPLNHKSSLQEKLSFLHRMIRKKHPAIGHIAVATYDSDSDLVKTLTYSNDRHSPLNHYETKLTACKPLLTVLEHECPSVINHLALFGDRTPKFGFSYTTPIIHEDRFHGFIFFSATSPDAFDERLLVELDPIAHLIVLLVVEERASIQSLVATIRSARHFAYRRDPETGKHLERMANYARLIARKLAVEHNLDDDYIEHVFLFAPLHDLGKIGIPDEILMKKGKLTEEEYAIMKTHARMGREMVDQLLSSHALEGVQDIEILRNIAEYHHEAVDGSGYPSGLKGNEIPLESRIVSVADVFDAVTSGRPYKPAWSNDDAIELLYKLAGNKLDRRCVEVFVASRTEVEGIQASFRENRFG